MNAEMVHLVQRLVEQQNRVFDICGEDRRSKPRPPISASSLSELNDFFALRSASIPPSYRMFLEVCDGIDDFSFSYHLLGSADLLSPAYKERESDLSESITGVARQGNPGLVLIGYHPETRTRLCIDLMHEPIEEGEAVILDGEPGNVSIHKSFLAFMQMRIVANDMTIAQLMAVRDGRLDGA